MKLRIYHWLILISFAIISITTGLLYYFTNVYDHKKDALQLISEALDNALLQQNDYMGLVAENFSEGRLKLYNEPSGIYPTFIYSDGKLISWSDHQYVPPYANLTGDYAIKFLETADARLIVKRKLIEARNTKVEIYSCIVLERKYGVENRYISSGVNPLVIPFAEEVQIIVDPKVGFPYLHEGNYYFSVLLKDGFQQNITKYFELAFLSCLLVFVLLSFSLFFFASNLISELGFFKSTLFFSIGLIFLRGVYIYADLPRFIYDSKLFNAKSYYADWLNQSLGDLALNLFVVLLFFWFLLINLTRFKHFLNFGKLHLSIRLLFGTMGANICVVSLIGTVLLILSVAENSQIPIDITHVLASDYLRVVFYLLVLMSSLIFFNVNHLFLILIAKNRISIFEILFYFFTAYVICFFVFEQIPNIIFIISLHLVYIIVVFRTKWILSLGKIRYTSYLYFFTAAIVCGIVSAMAVHVAINDKTLVKKQKFANLLLLENDVLAEYLIHEAVENIQEDVQLKSRFLSPQFVNKQLFDRIKRSYMHSYLDKYEINLRFFDTNGQPVNQNLGADNYDTLRRAFQKTEYATGFPEIFFVNDAVHFDLSRYYVFVPLQRYDIPLGYLLIELQLKMYMTSSVYPELLVDKRFFYTQEETFNYAMFRNGQFAYESGSFNYLVDFDATFLDDPAFYKIGIQQNEAHHLGVKGSDGKVFVITNEVYPFKSILSNFSFNFQLLLILIAAFSLLNALSLQLKNVQLNFATRLQLYLSIAMFLPLLFISVAILNSLNKSYNDEIEKEYRTKTENISRNINAELKDYLDNKINKEQLIQSINEISRYAQNDINLYDESGKLIATSQPLVFESNLISPYINPLPYYQIIAGEEEAVTFDERIGSLAYRSTYEALRSIQEGKLLGVLSIPFFQSQSYLDTQKVEVFNSIINIVTFIFLASFILTNFATSLLTRPLNLLANKLRKTRLDGENQPLNWNSNDEIGILVTEYNKMLVNLEKSRESLTQSEKEMAWREMARQVAHEIKNPLTPMKLTLQHMQRTLTQGSSEESQNTTKSINTLLQQIDTLSDIATSFSAFAQMPVPQNRLMNLIEVVKGSILLFQNEIEIKTNFDSNSVIVHADPNLIGRIMNNLLLNAKQAVPEERIPDISVSIKTFNRTVQVAVADNGVGIPVDIQSKIFIPNFSTKSSGSGLGLAIARRGIEHAGGKIWFETGIDVGTSFFFELPTVNG